MDTPIMMDVDPLSAYETQYAWSGQARGPVQLPNHLYPHTTIAEGMAHPAHPGTGPVPYAYQNEQAQNYSQNQYQPVAESHPDYNLSTHHQTSNHLPPTNELSTLDQLQPNGHLQTNHSPINNQLQPMNSQSQPMNSQTQPMNDQSQLTNHPNPTNDPNLQPTTNEPQPNQEEEDIKPDIAELEANLNLGKRKTKNPKPKGRVSTYWNKKITDKDFEFYGCSLCDVSFKDIVSLDKHMVMHSNRLTTYEFRRINIEKRKMLKKEQKKKKKEEKIKKETEKKETLKIEPEVEIKPEDGYIGTEKAGEIKNDAGKVTKPKQIRQKKKPKTLEDYDKNSPAYRRATNEGKYVHAYKCFACNKLFALSYYLRLHVRSHTGEKPYVCKTCGQGFITASKMNRHVKRIHMATRHPCRICYRVFTRFELLVKHFDLKHAEQKLDGEVYDYNAILPYLKELEEQLKEEKEKAMTKLKMEDTWDMPLAGLSDAMPKEEVIVAKKEDKVATPQNIEFVDESKPAKELSSDIKMVEHIKIDIEFKQETDDDDDGFRDNDSDDVFNQGDRDTDEEYVPTETWVRPHSPVLGNRKHKAGGNSRKKAGEKRPKIEDQTETERDGKSKRKWEQPTRCPLCDKYISKMKNLAVHMNTHTKKELKEQPTEERKKDKENEKESLENEIEDKKEEKIKEDPTSEEEYFPSETWARPPSPLPEPTGSAVRGGKAKTCPVCKKTVSSKTYLAIHMRTHTGEKPYACYICARAFITASKMHRHVLTHDETWEGKDIKPESEEESKEQVLDQAQAKMAAKESKRDFFSKKRKHGPWTHTCEFCNKRFLHQVTLQVHLKSHNPNESMKCYYCLEEFENADQLRAHKDNHTLPNMYQCQFCKKEFVKKGPMMAHRKKCKCKESDGDGKTLTCEICSKRFNCASRLRRHMSAHGSSQYRLKYECPVCAHMFHTRYHTHMHLRSHIKEGLIQEENRAAVFAMVLQNARRIPKNEHETPPPPLPLPAGNDERSRICNICGEIFQHFYFLEQHLKLHANKIELSELDDDGEVKKHVCPVCSKSFKLPYYLKLHSFTHTKEKPFICQECGKGFITRGKLKRHLETHQGLKKYQCHICYKFFTRTSYLRIHIRTIHGPQDYGLGLPIGMSQGLPLAS